MRDDFITASTREEMSMNPPPDFKVIWKFILFNLNLQYSRPELYYITTSALSLDEEPLFQ